MHLVPAERRTRRILEGERVCQAIHALDQVGDVAGWAECFAALGDPSRLALLVAIAASGPISVSDLAVAADLQDTTASHALALLRAGGAVVAERDGRVVRYRLADPRVRELLAFMGFDRVVLAAHGD